MSADQGPISVKRKTGIEPFHQSGQTIEATLQDYWTWGSSNLLDNTERGMLAEYIVALDLGVATGARYEWEAYDLATSEGVKVEVKSSAYIQSWHQDRLSTLRFNIAPHEAWDAETNEFDRTVRRRSDVYVFCVLAHKDQRSIDPLNLDQWAFYVLDTRVLDADATHQKSIGLNGVLKLGAKKVGFGMIQEAVQRAHKSTQS